MNLFSVTSFTLFLISLSTLTLQQEVGSHSFQPPFGLPYWTLGGDAHLTESFVRLAEDRQNKKGWFWNNMPSELREWEAVIQFRIHGVSRVGADGMAFWYTENSKTFGPLFGNEEKFKGLGVILDTYDNDNTGVHPYISVALNDGTRTFSHEHDGKTSGIQRGGCQMKYRNLQQTSSIIVTYKFGRLSVYYTLENSITRTPCVVNIEANLPPGYYFGFSAATGHLADNHDLHSFMVSNLDPSFVPGQSLEPSFGKILNSIYVSHRDSALTITQKQRELLLRIEDLNAALSTLNTDVQKQPRSVETAPSLASFSQPSGPRFDKECGNIMASLMNMIKTIERIEKDNKKIADLQTELKQTSQTSELPSSTSTVLSWINLFLLIGLIVFLSVNEIIKMNTRPKKFF